MANLMKFDPFAELSALQRQFFGDDLMTPIKGLTIPTTDVYTRGDKELIVEAHLPNFDQDDINVQVEDDALIVQAQKHEQEEDKSKKYVVRESSSSFYRRIVLPERADAENIEAHLENGILKVKVAMKALPEPKKIKVIARSQKQLLKDKKEQ
jgi:HSP20 family protein